MVELLESCCTGANIIATVLLAISLFYWLFVFAGVVGLDLFDFDVDTDAGDLADLDPGSASPGGSMLSIGAVALKSLNIGRVPIMVWASLFALAFWAVTVFWDAPENHASWSRELLILFRNVVLAVIAAKLLTEPLRGQFEEVEAESAADLIGRPCAVTTSRVTPQSGQVRCRAKAAPLLLNARTREESEPLCKGDAAVIVDYDPHQGIYFVEKASQEVPS